MAVRIMIAALSAGLMAASPAPAQDNADSGEISQDMSPAERSAAFLAENARRAGVATTASGLQYEIIEKSARGGRRPKKNSIVVVHYTGMLMSGAVFDSSVSRGAPDTFRVDGVIAGWSEGLQLMSAGDKYRFFIPPDLAYGAQGVPGANIGPDELLIFDVELIRIGRSSF
ncbi:MAG: FKBP-type peptidyl-prolyl cis-trans isomerase [Parvularculaceae bacterium]|nr:FKBP-type peptidyl-prolyl cis-trans isomerase [Parvularculaceae bacterium]